jgi:serine/threonine protein kinase
MITTSQTLAQRIADGRMPVAEGLQIAMQIAEQLRQWHDRGSAHGALTPSTIEVSGGVPRLLGPEAAEAKWLYEAPEVKLGAAPDTRSDIFSFGAIVFEILTGERIFVEGLAMGIPVQSGHGGIDRLVNGCVAQAPDSRYQHAQKIMLELRLLLATARRNNFVLKPPAHPAAAPAPSPAPRAEPVVESPAASFVPPPPPPPAPDAPAMQALHDLEGRISSRLQEQERTIANVAHVANEVLKALREQQTAAAAAYAAPPPPRPAPAPAAEPEPPQQLRGMGFRGYEEHSAGSRADKMLDLLSDKLSRLDLVVTSVADRMQKLEEIFDQFDTDAAALRDSVTRDIRRFEHTLKSQGAAIESARTAMGQTDDLVERVVEALDSLQAMFVTSAEEQTLAS